MTGTRMVVLAVAVAVTGCEGGRDASIASAAAATPGAIPDTLAGWSVRQDSSVMDGMRTTSVTRLSDFGAPGGPAVSQSFIGALGVECEGRDLGVFVSMGTTAESETGGNRYTVRLRFDSAPPVTEQWIASSDRQALFSAHSAAIVAHMSQAKRLLFEFNEVGEGAKVAAFDLSGLTEKLPLLHRCLPR